MSELLFKGQNLIPVFLPQSLAFKVSKVDTTSWRSVLSDLIINSIAVSGYLWECGNPKGKQVFLLSAMQEPLCIKNKRHISASRNRLDESRQMQQRSPRRQCGGQKGVVSQVGDVKAKV